MSYKYYNMNYTYLLAGAGIGGITYYTYKNPTVLMPYIVNIIRYYHMVTDYCYGNQTNNEPIKRKHSSINLICYDTTNKEEQITQNIKVNIPINNPIFSIRIPICNQ